MLLILLETIHFPLHLVVHCNLCGHGKASLAIPNLRHVSAAEGQSKYSKYNHPVLYTGGERILMRCHKCDQSQPECSRCRVTGHFCDRYDIQERLAQIRTSRALDPASRRPGVVEIMILSDWKAAWAAAALDAPSPLPQIRAQSLGLFLESYIPHNSIQRFSTRPTALSWYQDLPRSLGHSRILDEALAALSLAFVGNIHHDRRMLNESCALRNAVVTKVRQLKPGEGTRHASEVLMGVSMALVLYEVAPRFEVQEACGNGNMLTTRLRFLPVPNDKFKSGWSMYRAH
jgi:hypothetical protein